MFGGKCRNNPVSSHHSSRQMPPFAVEDSFAQAARKALQAGRDGVAVQAMFSDATRTPWPQRQQAIASCDALNGSLPAEPSSPRRSARKNTSFGDLGRGMGPRVVAQDLHTHEMRSLGMAERGRNSPMAQYCSSRHSAPWSPHPGCEAEDAQGTRSLSPDADGRIAGMSRKARLSYRAQAERYGGLAAPYGDEDGASTNVPSEVQHLGLQRSVQSPRQWSAYNFAGTDNPGSSFMTRLRSPVDALQVPGDRTVERQASAQQLWEGPGFSPGVVRMRTAPPANQATTSGAMSAAIHAHWAAKNAPDLNVAAGVDSFTFQARRTESHGMKSIKWAF